jgi:hypothetical protein
VLRLAGCPVDVLSVLVDQLSHVLCMKPCLRPDIGDRSAKPYIVAHEVDALRVLEQVVDVSLPHPKPPVHVAPVVRLVMIRHVPSSSVKNDASSSNDVETAQSAGLRVQHGLARHGAALALCYTRSRRPAMQRRRFDPPAALKLALAALLALASCKRESAGTAGDLGRTSESSAPIQPSPAGATGPAVDTVHSDSVRADSVHAGSAGGQLALPPAVGSTTMTLPSIGATVLVPAASIPSGPGMRRPGFDTSTTPPAPFPHPAKPGPP